MTGCRHIGCFALSLLLLGCTGLFEPPRPGSDASSGRDADGASAVDAAPDGCVPDCVGRECGPDGCGGACPPGCSAPFLCDLEWGGCQCVPACADRECGGDGCGGVCPPGCSPDMECHEGSGSCVCPADSFFGAPCGEELCLDGSLCADVGGGDGVCAARCEVDGDCRNIAPGGEECITLNEDTICVVLCSSDADCPCGLPCRSFMMGMMRICRP